MLDMRFDSKLARTGRLALSDHYSRDWSEYVNVVGAICEPFVREFTKFRKAPYVSFFETRFESNFVCPTKVFS